MGLYTVNDSCNQVQSSQSEPWCNDWVFKLNFNFKTISRTYKLNWKYVRRTKINTCYLWQVTKTDKNKHVASMTGSKHDSCFMWQELQWWSAVSVRDGDCKLVLHFSCRFTTLDCVWSTDFCPYITYCSNLVINKKNLQYPSHMSSSNPDEVFGLIIFDKI